MQKGTEGVGPSNASECAPYEPYVSAGRRMDIKRRTTMRQAKHREAPEDLQPGEVSVPTLLDDGSWTW